MIRLLRGFLALLVLVSILVGAPWLLWHLGQLPGFLPRGLRLAGWLSAPDDGRIILLLVWAAGWVLWAWMVVLISVELVAAIRGVSAPRLPAASLPQGWARALVIAAVALFLAGPHPLALATSGQETHLEDQHLLGAQTTAVSPLAPTASGDAQGDTAGRPAPAPAAREIAVERGDTLWDLSEEHLGDPRRWPELYEHNRGVPQADGRILDDPDRIHPGWSLRLPGTGSSPAPAPREPAGSEYETSTAPPPAVTDAGPATAGQDRVEPETHPSDTASREAQRTPRDAMSPPSAPTVPVTKRAVPATAPAAAEQVAKPADAEVVPQWWHVSGLLGAGVILGVGVGAGLARRRREQFRTRRPGRVIPEPPAAVAPIEQTAQLARGLAARQVVRLDQVLRRLGDARWPSVEAVAMARDGTLLLRTVEPLHAPWEQSDDGWLLPGHVPLDRLGPPAADQPCPYPLLVSVGADSQDRVWLVNLAAIGILQVAGDPVMRADFLRYLAAELAMNPWSDGARIACQGSTAEVVPMAPQRLDASVAEVTTIAASNAQRATRTGTDATRGRAHQLGDEAWPAAAVLATEVDPDAVEELASLIVTHPHATGAALVTTAPQGGLTVTPDGRVQGLGLDLTAVGLTEDEAAGCAALLAAAEAEHHPQPAAADALVDVTGNVLPTHRRPSAVEDPASTQPILPANDAAYLDQAVVTGADLEDLAPRVAAPVALDLQQRDPGLDAELDRWFAEHCAVPRLSVLGPVTARCLGKPIAKQKGYYVEVLAYLALHPNGVTTDELAEAFSLTPQRARTVISNCRQWVGYRPGTGEPFLPDARATAQAKARGTGVYLVDDCLIDAELFRRLRARAIGRGPDGIEDLELALRLVRGRPFEQLRPGGWSWLLEGDRLDQHLVCAVGDVAHLLVTHHRQQGDLERALWAAQIGLKGDPDSETLRLDLAGIMVDEGHSDAARRVLAETLGDAAEFDLTDRAERILQNKRWLETT